MYKFAIQIRLCVYWKECKTWWRTMHAKPQRTGVTRRFVLQDLCVPNWVPKQGRSYLMKFLPTETRQTSPFNIVQAFAPKAKPVATHIFLPKPTAQEPISAFVLAWTKQPRLQGVVTPFTTAPLGRYSQSCSWRSSSQTNVQLINVPNSILLLFLPYTSCPARKCRCKHFNNCTHAIIGPCIRW